MATILFAAAGAALGSGVGGTILGMSGAIAGRAIGATLGRAIDQRILGGGSDAVEVGRIDRFQITGASQGASVPQVWGRMRMAGQVIWSSPFHETQARRGGKGMPSPRVTQFSYSVSLAIALCEGEILGIGKIWADGNEIKQNSLAMRVYHGTDEQLPDPVIEAFEGAQNAPAYRGIAYVVIENLDLSLFGNRIPQLSFEVMRRSVGRKDEKAKDLQDSIRAVALIPGTGEYTYSIKKQSLRSASNSLITINENSPSGETDFLTSMNQLSRELPNCAAVSLVISWFGNDLRCENCKVQPKVEQKTVESSTMPWRVGGISRRAAVEIEKSNGRSIYGGTPSDDSVIDAIEDLKSRGMEVMFYPFILMDQIEGNKLTDPYSGNSEQPALPWRGRITLSSAPGAVDSPDTTSEATRQVNSFFGSARAEDFSVSDGKVIYAGVPDWGYRYFILHYAYLCKLAGGVEAFCIGSELRGLTTIRGENDSFPTVLQFIELLKDVRQILPSSVKISYAADWSEYFGYQVGEQIYFHLDAFWARPEVDFVGIDYYVPLSDWRSSSDHKDSDWGSNYYIDYIKSNIMGGEGFDWFYSDDQAEKYQIRTPINDGAYGEHWIYRPKDLVSWWSNLHYERNDGVRSSNPTEWRPQSKPFRFTEYGCAAIDKGTNQPNKFLDPRSSESGVPRDSLGSRDDFIQMQFYRAMSDFWNSSSNNPASSIYLGSMLDWKHSYAWAWDVRPYPDFPRNEELWSDGRNYYCGHWLNGRTTGVALDVLLDELCGPIISSRVNVENLFGCVQGYSVLSTQSARAKIQPLAQIFSFNVFEDSGHISFLSSVASSLITISPDETIADAQSDLGFEFTRLSPEITPDCVRFSFIESDGNYATSIIEVSGSEGHFVNALETEFPGVLNVDDAKGIALRLLSHLNVSKDLLSVSLPPSSFEVLPGKILHFKNKSYQVEHVELNSVLNVKAVGVDSARYSKFQARMDHPRWTPFIANGPIEPIWMELPLFHPNQLPIAPHVAITATSLRKPVVLWTSTDDFDYEVNTVFNSLSWVGHTETPLSACLPGVIDRARGFLVRMPGGLLSSISFQRMLAGRNRIAIGDGSNSNWEIVQFKDAVLLPSGLWQISTMLRGQFGSDSHLPEIWPSGSKVVFLDENVEQAQISSGLRGVTQHCRIAFEGSNLDDSTSSYSVHNFKGVGLIPLSVCHIRLLKRSDLAHEFSWTRRSRGDSNSWDDYETPLNEEQELYSFKVFHSDGVFVREMILHSPAFSYAFSLRMSDEIAATYFIEVSQISLVVGLGHKRIFWVV